MHCIVRELYRIAGNVEGKNTGKQGLKYGTVALTNLLHNGGSENSVFRVMLQHSAS